MKADDHYTKLDEALKFINYEIRIWDEKMRNSESDIRKVYEEIYPKLSWCLNCNIFSICYKILKIQWARKVVETSWEALWKDIKSSRWLEKESSPLSIELKTNQKYPTLSKISKYIVHLMQIFDMADQKQRDKCLK